MAKEKLARVRLMMGPGTLPSRGHDRMDMTRYRISGKPQMTGAEMLAEIPEIKTVADVTVDGGNPYNIACVDDLCKLSKAMQKVLDDAAVDGVVFVQGTNSIEET
ncbi:MAG: asparaginase domain-containing protein, partial [Burkholderiales bacterium]